MTQAQGKSVQIGRGPGTGRGEREIAWCRDRPHEHRTPMPKPGDHVLYRANEWMDTVDAYVVAVNINPGENRENLALPDPWPQILIRVEPPWPAGKLDTAGHKLAGAAGPRPYQVQCHEARLAGAAGWLPLDHEQRFHPLVGA